MKKTPVFAAFLEGWRRVVAAPALSAGVLVGSFLFALPLALAVGGMIEEHLGSSLEADRLVAGWNPGWAQEFASQAQGLGRTFTHEIMGFGGTIATASDFIDRVPLHPTILGAVSAYLLVWVFLSGGILDRLARGRRIGTGAFFSACATFFVRFIRLGIVIGAAYWALFRWLHPYLLVTLYDRWTRDLTVERTAILLRVLLYLIFLAALMIVSLVADYAKVRSVVEDRRSMLGALVASLRFIRRRPLRVTGLYLLNVIALLVVVRLWLQTAPDAAAPVWQALLVTQAYLLLRIWTKLAFMSAEVVFFQGELAHAGYTAAPEAVWPDSPAAEAIENLTRSRARANVARGPSE